MFYYDMNLKKYESEFLWNKSLLYLEDLFLDKSTCEKTNSLVGFAWYYLIEGPIYSGKYDKDENSIALEIWKRYLKIGFKMFHNEPSFNFIAGYSLMMHGFYIEEYKNNYEQIGLDMLNKVKNSADQNLKEVVNIIFEYQKQKKYKPLKIKQEVIKQIFGGDSLLEKYFIELYS